MKHQNMAMLCDFYEFTMSNGYFKNGFYKRTVYFRRSGAVDRLYQGTAL